MAPRSILKSIPFISHFPFPNTHSNSHSQLDCNISSPVLTPSSSDNPWPFASSSRIPPLDSPHVHFPPTPTISRMGMTHSPFSYDRKPIAVSPNVCALPERGERDVCDREFELELSEEFDGAECIDREYCHPWSYVSRNIQRRGEASSRRFSSRSSGTRSLSPSRPTRTTRFRCHSLPSPSLPQDTLPRIYPNHPRRHTDPYPSPSRHQAPIAVPPLVFDHSSEESDSEDMCESPLPQAADLDYFTSVPGDGVSHITTHFLGGLSLAQGETPFSTLGPAGSQFTDITKVDDTEKSVTETRQLGGVVYESTSDLVPDSSTSSDGLGLLARTKTRSRDSGACGFSKFCEPVLEGCLGGF